MRKGVEHVYHLKNKVVSLVLDCRGPQPAIAYYGARLTAVSESMLEQLDRHEAPASLSVEPAVTLSPTHGMGYLGHAGLAVRRDHDQWQINPKLIACEASESELRFFSICERLAVELTHCLRLDSETGVLALTVTVANTHHSTALSVDQCLVTVPTQDHLTEACELTGRWGYELQQNRFQLPYSSVVRENRTGRTSHHLHPSLRLLSANTSLDAGDAIDLQVAWSGNHTIRVEQLADGRRTIQAGELLEAGELELGPGEHYTSPQCLLCFSDKGLNGLSQQWHRFIRNTHGIRPGSSSRSTNGASHSTSDSTSDSTSNDTNTVTSKQTRPVQLNTWEACYFAVDAATIIELVDQAASLGIERFVLDDGWFRGRNNDRTSLGDWQVDEKKFPSGLGPIAAHCNDKGLEFGLWIEPEMVSPDSDLYRAHPDWILSFSNSPLIEARNQLVLDLGREEVVDYLFESISALLDEIPISYLKWDMNRDVHQMENASGRRAVQKQTMALYALMARVRDHFPHVAIESCASGGGRIDMGVLQYATRFWPSDTNDALDRVAVQTGFLSMLPPELMGTHVGPSPCHLTGRQHTMPFRAGVALWGHMGVEADIRTLTESERSTLAAAISLHKQHRRLLHQGRYIAHEPMGEQVAWSIVSDDQAELLTAVALLRTPITAFPKRMRFQGLDANRRYQVQLIWPQDLSATQADYRYILKTKIFGGDWLQRVGIALPIMQPESILIFHLEAVEHT